MTAQAPRSDACRSSERAHGWWFGFVPDVRPGQRYNLRVDGAWDPERGLRHNAAKLLLDPYARAIEGEVSWGPEVFGHVVDATWGGDGELPSALDSRAHVPRCVVVDDTFDWEDDRPPGHALSETVIYEAHVRNQTVLHPEIPQSLRGTYAGLAHPASVAHLTGLGVTAVELLPIHAFTHEPHLVADGHDEPLGLQLPRLLRAARRLRRGQGPPGGGRRVQGHGQAPPSARASRSSSTSSTTTRPSRAGPAPPCRGAAWTSGPTTGSTSAAGTSTSRAAATPWTCAIPSSAAWCSTHCATGCRRCTWTDSASTSPSRSAEGEPTSSTRTTRSSWRCARIPSSPP